VKPFRFMSKILP